MNNEKITIANPGYDVQADVCQYCKACIPCLICGDAVGADIAGLGALG
jgi:hypothetical protein